MTEDFDDGASTQPLKAEPIDVDSRLIRDACRAHNERVMAKAIEIGAQIEAAACTVLLPNNPRIFDTIKAEPKPWITPAELLAWRTYMRANPPTPETTKKPHYRPESVWEKPQEWLRRDGAEQ